MKKKILLPLLMLCIGSCAVATATGCNNDGQTEPTTMETLISKDSITLELNQEYTLDLVYDGKETPTWKVGDSTIVSVENGKLVALKSGTTTVTVTVGSYTDTVTVTVSEMDTTKLSLEVADSNVTLYKNDEKQIFATVKYNGVVIDSAAEKSYESTNADIVSVDANGKMTAKAYGNATITVSYKVYGASLLSSVNVSVVSGGKVEIAQSSAELVYRGEPVTLTAKVTEKGVEQTNAAITWSATSGQDVITISADGKITAQNAGETEVTATYVDNEGQTQTDTITVTVLSIDVNTQKSIAASYDEKEHANGYSLDLENVIDDGVEKIIGAYTEEDGMRVNIPYAEGKFDFSEISSGNTDLYVKTRNVIYKVALSLAKTYYLDNNNFINRMSKGSDGEKTTYVIEENIVLTDAWTTSATFSGTLDGNGHSITGLSVATQAGLFSVLKNATIKNVSVVNATLGGEETGVFAWKTEDTVTFDNVYVSIANTVFGEYYATTQNDLVLTNQSQKAGLVSQSGTAAITVKDSVIYMPENLTNASGFVASWGTPTLTITGTTFIGGNGAVVGTRSGKTTNVTYTSGGNDYKAIDAVQAYKDLYGNDFDKTVKDNANDWSAMIVAAYEANHPLKVWGASYFTAANLKKLTETTGDIIVLTQDVTVTSNFNTGIISGVFDGQGHKISGIIGGKNVGGLFARVQGSVKNVSFAGDLDGTSAGLVANTVQYNAYLENVYCEVKFGSTITDGGYSQGGIFRVVANYSTSLSMKNVVVNVQGSEMPAASGAIVGYGSALKTVPTNALGVYMDNCSYIAPSAQPMGSRGETTSYFGKVTGADKYFFWDKDANHTTDDGLTYYATVAALKTGVSGLSTFMMNIINGLA